MNDAMTFEWLLNEPACVCIDSNSTDNSTKILCRLIMGPKLNKADFKSHWEIGLRPKGVNPGQASYCKNVCDLKGVSVHECSSDAEFATYCKNKADGFNKTRAFKPTAEFPTHYCKLKLARGGGRVRMRPTRNDSAHRDILKADGFKLSHIVVVEIAEMPSCLP